MALEASYNNTVQHRFSAASTSFYSQYGAGGGGCGLGEQEMDLILLDHGYAKPWSAHPDASNARPLRMLFVPKQPRGPNIDQNQRNGDAPIDIEEVAPMPSMPFDATKARTLMTECERHASFSRPDDHLEDWEEKISKIGWTVQQNRVFTKVMKALQSDRLARLAMDGVPNEPIARRLVVDKTAKRLRQALASVSWDTKVVRWLHQLILDSVSVHLLASYLDALQTLKAKVPTLVDKMVSETPPRHPSLSSESLGQLIKRPWDPVGNALSQQKPKKLPGNPLLLIAPSGPTQGGSSGGGNTKRLKFWQGQLQGLGKVVPVTMHTVNGGSGVSVALCLEHMIGAVRTKVLELKSHFPGRPIVLFGWNVGALVACHVSLVESVSGVVCLGFPFTGIHGPRGDVEDPLLDSRTPTLFLIGQNASDCSVDQIQDLREHMRAETGLVVVGGADEQLRLSHRQKREEGLTQAMADRCIMDEICQFLGSVLSLNMSIPDPGPDVPPVDQRKKRKRKTIQEMTSASFDSRAAQQQEAPTLTATGRVSKRGGKMARQAVASGAAYHSTERTRGSPRKRQGRGGLSGGPRKRLALSVGQLAVSASNPSAASLQSGSSLPIATVSSAPELSGLLQGIRVTRPGSEVESALVGGRSLVSTSIPLTKLLTIGKLTDVTDGGAGGLGGASATATLLASAMKSGEAADKDVAGKLSQQQQILVRTGGTPGTPLTIPISMAHRLVGLGAGASPLVHITGTGTSSTSQIHQLLTSIARSASSSVSASPAPQTVLLTSMATSAATSTTAADVEKPAGVSQGRSSRSSDPSHLSQEKEENAGADSGLGQGEGQGQTEEEKLQAIQRSQFHDFPLTSTPLTALAAKPADRTATLESGSASQQPSSLSVAVTRSLINTAAMSGSVSSILGKVVTGSVSQAAGAATAGSMLGGRNAVLITSLGKTVSPSTCATLLSKLEKSDGSGGVAPGAYMVSSETLGKVSSLLESSPVIRMAGQSTAVGTALAKPSLAGSGHTSQTSNSSLAAGLSSVQPLTSTAASGGAGSTPTSASTGGGGGGGRGRRDSASSSYAASAKPVMPTVASTRTRRIRTPKQYDL